MDLKVKVADVEGAPHSFQVSVAGSITSANLHELQDVLEKRLGPKQPVPIVNLQDASYIASVGLTYLVALVDRMDRFGGLVILVNVNPKLRALFETLGVEPLFQIAPTLEGAEALAKSQEQVIASAPRLVEIAGANPGTEFPILSAVLSIGSDPRCTLVIKHPQVDRRHAEVFIHENQVYVKDLGTLFGTYVGKDRVQNRALKDGDVISIGMFRFEFRRPGR